MPTKYNIRVIIILLSCELVVIVLMMNRKTSTISLTQDNFIHVSYIQPLVNHDTYLLHTDTFQYINPVQIYQSNFGSTSNTSPKES